MTTQALTEFDPKQFLQTTAHTATGTQRLDTKVSAVAVSNDLEGRLSVTTAEGDKITLSADLEYNFRAVNYASKVQTDDATVDVNAQYVEASLKREFGVTVEGNLNEQELKDLDTLFRKVSNIVRNFFSGHDEPALAKTAHLSEQFGNLSSLSSLDLSVDVERSVTVLAAQIASESIGQPSLPSPLTSQTSTAPTSTVTLGGTPAAGAAIPQPSTGTTAPTQSTPTQPATDSSGEVRLNTTASEAQPLPSLIQQVLNTLRDSHVDTHTVQKYLPSFLQHLREELMKELQQGRNDTEPSPASPVNQNTSTTINNLLVSYQAVRYTTLSLSIHS